MARASTASRPAAGTVGGLGVAALTAAATAISAAALYGLWAFWPSEATARAREEVRVTFFDATLSRNVLLVVAVACAGALGALPRALRWLELGAGNRELRWCAAPRALLALLVGSAAGTILFLLLVSVGVPSGKQASPYWFAALAALLGLASWRIPRWREHAAVAVATAGWVRSNRVMSFLRRKHAEDDAHRVPRQANRVGPVGAVVFLLCTVALAAFALYGLWVFWPSEDPHKVGALLKHRRISFFGWNRVLSRESLFFVMVAFAGALGGMVHATRSLAVYLGNRELKWSWAPFYILKPVLGAILATLLYFTLRAGLFSPSASTQNASPYGFAAIGALAGLFSDQAVEKLRKIAEELFEKLPPQKDHYAGPEVVTGNALSPSTDPNAATLSGTVNPAGRETTWYFEYGKAPNYGQTTETQTMDAGTDDVVVEVRVEGLEAGESYQYRLVAINEDGTTRGNIGTFTAGATDAKTESKPEP